MSTACHVKMCIRNNSKKGGTQIHIYTEHSCAPKDGNEVNMYWTKTVTLFDALNVTALWVCI